MNNPNKSVQSVFREDVAYLEKLKVHTRQSFAEVLHLVVEEHKIIHRTNEPEPLNSETQNTPTDNLTKIEKKELGLSPVTSTTNTSQ